MEDLTALVREKLTNLDQFMGDVTKRLDGLDDRCAKALQLASSRGGPFGVGGPVITESLGLGGLVVKSESVKQFLGGSLRGAARVDIPGRLWSPVQKTVTPIATDTGGLKPGVQNGGIAPLPLPPTAVVDLIPSIPLTEGSYQFARQKSPHATAAIQASEGGAKNETTLDFETVTLIAQTLACWAAASKQSIADAAGLQLVIDTDLLAAIRALEETEILLGDGTAGHLTGIVPVATAVTPTATSRIDAVSELIAALVVAGVAPSAVVLNPADWLAMTTLKAEDSGVYLLGAPTQPPPQTLWGVRLALSSAMPSGSALAGDFARGAVLGYREAATVEISSEHADFFVRNLLAIRAEERMLLAIRQPSAFAKMTLPGGGA